MPVGPTSPEQNLSNRYLIDLYSDSIILNMSMVTHDLIFRYDVTLPSMVKGNLIILYIVDKQKIDEFAERFFEDRYACPPNELMIYSEVKAELQDVLSFIGYTFEEACTLFPFVQYMVNYRRNTSDESAYIEVLDWQMFFELHAKGIYPIDITLRIVEHY